MSEELPNITTGELRALGIAARHVPRGPASERVEKHPLGRQYVTTLEKMGLLAMYPGRRGNTREITPLAVALLRAHWLGERMTVPKEMQVSEQDAG